jgi:glyoxylase-like metal-dependent hydrolase (beta-lactamase superfamily II)
MPHALDFRIISIGTLAAHPLWDERAPIRTGHTTTTLIRSGDMTIIVDPGLPAPALKARLHERSGLLPNQITHVFLTSFHPEARRGIELFDQADWFISELERETVGVPIAQSLGRLAESQEMAKQTGEAFHEDQQATLQVLQRDIAILARTQASPDSLSEDIDLFPLPGLSPGSCGLLLKGMSDTTLISGDTIATKEHLEQGKVLAWCADRKKAMESFQESIEIADMIIPGRDNLLVNPTNSLGAPIR